jgi:hypothetical protein
MEKDSTWEFLLDGNLQDFRQMSQEYGTEYFNIYGGIDDLHDCKNDDFRMTTIYCDDEDDPRVVWEIGHELISLFNGASVLFRKDHIKASIYKLWRKNIQVDYFPISSSSGLLGPPSYSFLRRKTDLAKLKKEDFRLFLLCLATEHTDIYLILKYFNMEAGWITYYKIMETIESLAKEKNISLKTNQSQRKFFTNTANNFSLSGLDSRHGFKQAAKENKTSSMTIDQGYVFVSNLAKDYLCQLPCVRM